MRTYVYVGPFQTRSSGTKSINHENHEQNITAFDPLQGRWRACGGRPGVLERSRLELDGQSGGHPIRGDPSRDSEADPVALDEGAHGFLKTGFSALRSSESPVEIPIVLGAPLGFARLLRVIICGRFGGPFG